MRILDKYIIKHIGYSYLSILLIFIGLYLVIDIFSTLSDILKAKPNLFILLEYYIQSLPLIITRVSPIALLISTLYTFGELNKNNEIISIRACGLSVARIAFPALFFALLISISVFFLQQKVLIKSQKRVADIKVQFITKKLDKISQEQNLAFTSGNMILFVGTYLPKYKTMEQVVIFEEDRKRRIVKKIIAKEIAYEHKQWVAKDIVEYSLDEAGDIIDVPLSWDEKIIDIDEKPESLVYKKGAFSQFSSLTTLRKEINRLKKIKADNLLSNLIIDYYQKMAEPFSHLFLIIGVLPLALEIRRRKVALSSLGIGFIFGFLYYAISSFSIALGKSGIILPVFSALLAPLFFLTVGISGIILLK